MRRIIDIIVSLAAILLAAPLLLVIALAIVVDSPGKPLYPAWRTGQGGTLFRMWKFRTMIPGADRMGRITAHGDRRVTRLGWFLRKTKFDELPQFVNVLLGDMTLVGPRPESPEIVALYTPDQNSILTVKPGLTGRAQLTAADESDTIPSGSQADEYYLRNVMDRKLQMDLEYLRTRTPLSDVRIVIATARLVGRSLIIR